MRIALLSPFTSGPLRGNTITVQRIAQYLPTVGCDPLLISLDTVTLRQARQMIDQHQSQLLHAFHAFHGGSAARQLAAQSNCPYLITMTGSDLYDPDFYSHPETLLALKHAAAITCFDQVAVDQLTSCHPELATEVRVIPQGVTPLPVRAPVARPANSFIILLPAAIRPVKGLLEAVTALAPLADQAPQLRLWIAGGVLDAPYGEQLRQLVEQLPWVELLGEIPHEQMGDLFAACDLVMNNSRFEGGMANTLLEAMAAAKPVIASDVAGNRSLIRHGETGWLFHDQQQLRQVVQQALEAPALLQTIGITAQELVASHFSPQREATELATLYQQLLSPQRT